MFVGMKPVSAGDEQVAPAAQQRMLEVCRQVITRAAQDTWQESAIQHQHAGVPHHVSDGTSWEQVHQSQITHHVADGTSWEQACLSPADHDSLQPADR